VRYLGIEVDDALEMAEQTEAKKEQRRSAAAVADRPIPAGGGARMPSGKQPFIIDHCAAMILPVLPEKMIDMMEAPIKGDL
jgi:hypothetical protein